MANLALTLLGGFEARLADGTRVPLPAKACALLAYLAVRPGVFHLRDKLAAMLWSESTDTQARDSLRHVINLLRKSLVVDGRQALLIDKQSYALDPAFVSSDVVDFQQLANGRTPDAMGRAVDLYRGDFLDGLLVSAPPFEEWLVAQREQLREIVVELLGRLVADCAERGDVDAAVQRAVTLLALDPLQEAAHRTLMRLYARQGRRAAALRQYQTCVDAVRRELGIEPEPETKKVYREILSSSESAARSEPRPLPTAGPKLPLVAREPEMNRLLAHLASASGGNGRAVVISGEAGVGKSRLAAELVELAAAGDHTILFGRCYESERSLPLSVWVQALRSADLLSSGVVGTLDAAWRAELARVLPELAEAAPGYAISPEEHTRLFDAVARLVEHAARRRALVIVLEDLHWADPMSLQLLPFVARRTARERVLIVGTARDEHLADAATDLQVAVRELAQQSSDSTVALHPLSRDETLGLIAAADPRAFRAPRVAEQVWLLSEGNPFVALETMHAVAEGAETERLAVPDRVRGMIAARLARLSDRARQLAAVAAVIGRDFEFALLREAAALDEAQTAEGLEELVRRQIVRLAGERFAFAHDRLRRAVYDELIPPRRAALHLAVAKALEHLHPNRLDEVAERLGYHYAQTDDIERAIAYLRRFARLTGDRYALAEAVAVLDDADALARRLPDDRQTRTRLELLLQKCDYLVYLGRFPLLVDALQRNAGLVERAGDPSLTGRYHFWFALPLSLMGQHQAATEHAMLALAAAGEAGDRGTQGRAHAVLALKHFWSSHPIDGIAAANRAVELLTGSGDDEWLCVAYFYAAVNAIQLGDLDAAMKANDAATTIADRTDSARLKTFAGWSTGWAEAALGHADRAAESCRRAADTAPDPLGIANARGFLGYAKLQAGEPAAAIAALDDAVRRSAEFGFHPQHGWFSAWLAEAYLASGDVVRARRAAGDAVAISRQVAFPFGIGLALRARGRVAMAELNVLAARADLQEAAAIFAAIPARHDAARLALDLSAADEQRLV